MTGNPPKFDFELVKLPLIFGLINDLFSKQLTSELTETDEAELVHHLRYDLTVPGLAIHVLFRYIPDANIVTAHIECPNPDSFISIKMLFSFATTLSREKASSGVLEYLEPLFGDVPRPDQSELMGCSLEHLAACSECQEAQDNFAPQQWQDASGDWDAPIQYADICFLSPAAKLYFFPAYLLTAVKYEESTIIESAEFFLDCDKILLSHPQRIAVELVRFFIYEQDTYLKLI